MSKTRRRPIKRDHLGRRTGHVTTRESRRMARLHAEEQLTVAQITKLTQRDPRTVKKVLGTGQRAPTLLAAEAWPHGHLSTRPKDVLRGDDASRWTSGRPQQAGDGFVLQFGEDRSIKSVRFLQGQGHQWDCPKRWRMTFQRDTEIVHEVEGEGFIEVALQQPVAVRMIGVDILEPRLPTDHPPATCWAADNIEISG